VDFMLVSVKSLKKDEMVIYPKFIVTSSKDLMVRGGDFYAVWDDEKGMWSTDQDDVTRLIDHELDQYKEEHADLAGAKVLHMWDADSGMIDKWLKYVQKQLRDNYHPLDEKLIFANSPIDRMDYASKRLPYALEKAETPAYEELISTLYSPEERKKIEWAIGSVVAGDSKKIQKFLVFYGSAGTGKSTILNIIQQLFDGYCTSFDAKALGSSSGEFALEPFKKNPLVAIQHDGNLSRIEDNTRLNSLVSHEEMTVNEKFKSQYTARFQAMLFMGTNTPVRITDSRSGIIRRLIDVSPTGNTVPLKRYNQLKEQVKFELGGIAQHCLEVYESDKDAYENYIPTSMIGATNDFYNFVEEYYEEFIAEDPVSLNFAWILYKHYCDDAKVSYPYGKRVFKEELKNYFREFEDRGKNKKGELTRSLYRGFRMERMGYSVQADAESGQAEAADQEAEVNPSAEEAVDIPPWLIFDKTESLFDKEYGDCPAQYANDEGTPLKSWDNVQTTLADISTDKLHYVRTPLQLIVIDFDIKNDSGQKSLERNIAAASKWPATYAELSKSGQGIHLHYIYNGDVAALSRVYDDNVEVKIFNGKSSLRRMLTRCNDRPIATINSGLPLKGDRKMVNHRTIKTEAGLRSMIKRNLQKEIGGFTKVSVDFIYNDLEAAYNAGFKYDVSDLRPAVFSFAGRSHNNKDYCTRLVRKMKFKSEDPAEPEAYPDISEVDLAYAEEAQKADTGEAKADGPLIFFDVEVFPNLCVIVYKAAGCPAVKMINPSAEEVRQLMRMRLVGFNNLGYDNYILYAIVQGFSVAQLYKLSRRLINNERVGMREARNVSYTDIFDFSATKQSLKKWEIALDIHHQELGLPWDEPVPEELWPKVAEYCVNDVVATEALFFHQNADWTARQILADVADKTVNDTTNTLTTAIIFGGNRNPQGEFNYRDMGKMPSGHSGLKNWPGLDCDPEFTVFDDLGRPVFPGYSFTFDKEAKKKVSFYRGEDPKEGGYVYAEPGIYWDVALLDIASMHPSSIVAEELFGPIYTARFKELLDARIAIKHKDFDKARTMLDGKLAPYIQKVIDGEITTKDLAYALKIAINSVYGLTAANFENPFHDPRNQDNIVAKRGALFMINLKHEVQSRGFTVAHIKTDSIKIPNATPEIIQFVTDYGKLYGYSFEHEATYSKMCLVNDAVYVARYAAKEKCEELYGYIPGDNYEHGGDWTATGTQFQVPYVFKTLFSHEPIEFKDMCETKAVKTALYLDMNENLPDVEAEEKELVKLKKKLADEKKPPSEADRAAIEQRVAKLSVDIPKGHDYQFVGKVGCFCPVKAGLGAGKLMRQGANGYSAVGGTTGYRWMEAEKLAQTPNWDQYIDKTYYAAMVDTAVEAISKYGDFEEFSA